MHERFPRLSPNNEWLAYVANGTTGPEVWVMRYPQLEPRYQVTTEGGMEPVWSGDGESLYYRVDAAAHARGVENHDIKPDNVRFTRDDHVDAGVDSVAHEARIRTVRVGSGRRSLARHSEEAPADSACR